MKDPGRRFNLNLLPILDALLECRSVTRAGERFHIAQPTASAALSKLREALGDELLVPVGRDMKLTARAEEIREPVRQLLELLESVLRTSEIDPKAWRGEFTLATADYVAMLILPHLLEKTRETPQLTVRVTNITRSSLSNLRAGEIDMMISLPELVDDESLMSRRLFSDRFVLLHSTEFPPPSSDITDYLQREHVETVIDAPSIGDSPRNFFNQDLDALRSMQRNPAVVPYYSMLPVLVAGSPRVALVQERLAKMFEKMLPVTYSPVPVEIPPVELHMFWSPEFNNDARHAWMRDAIYEVCGSYR